MGTRMADLIEPAEVAMPGTVRGEKACAEEYSLGFSATRFDCCTILWRSPGRANSDRQWGPRTGSSSSASVCNCQRTWTRSEIACREIVTELENLAERIKDMQNVFDLAIDLIGRARPSQGVPRTTGRPLEGLSELDDALRKLTSLKDKHLFRLAILDREVIAEAWTEHAAGDYPSPDAALADLLAARHAARITPSYAELRRWVDQSPPEPVWFEEAGPPQ